MDAGVSAADGRGEVLDLSRWITDGEDGEDGGDGEDGPAVLPINVPAAAAASELAQEGAEAEARGQGPDESDAPPPLPPSRHRDDGVGDRDGREAALPPPSSSPKPPATKRRNKMSRLRAKATAAKLSADPKALVAALNAKLTLAPPPRAPPAICQCCLGPALRSVEAYSAW